MKEEEKMPHWHMTRSNIENNNRTSSCCSVLFHFSIFTFLLTDIYLYIYIFFIDSISCRIALKEYLPYSSLETIEMGLIETLINECIGDVDQTTCSAGSLAPDRNHIVTNSNSVSMYLHNDIVLVS